MTAGAIGGAAYLYYRSRNKKKNKSNKKKSISVNIKAKEPVKDSNKLKKSANEKSAKKEDKPPIKQSKAKSDIKAKQGTKSKSKKPPSNSKKAEPTTRSGVKRTKVAGVYNLITTKKLKNTKKFEDMDPIKVDLKKSKKSEKWGGESKSKIASDKLNINATATKTKQEQQTKSQNSKSKSSKSQKPKNHLMRTKPALVPKSKTAPGPSGKNVEKSGTKTRGSPKGGDAIGKRNEGPTMKVKATIPSKEEMLRYSRNKIMQTKIAQMRSKQI